MKKWSAYPYIFWSILFVVVPLIIILGFSLTIKTPDGIKFSIDNFAKFLEPMYLKVLIRSIELAVVSTILCLILGYPMAMILSGMEDRKRNLVVMLFVLPMWMNFLLRTYAWVALLSRNGFINALLEFLNLEKVNMMFTDGAVLLGMVYNFIPFMILPIYTVLSKINKNKIEAAQDLGANKITVFFKIIVPLSIPGIVSGITMVFMPAVSTFVISALLGGGQYTLIGNLVEQQFLSGDWYFGSAISIVLMIMILISMTFMQKVDKQESGGRI